MTILFAVSIALVAVGACSVLAAISVRVLRVEQPSREPRTDPDLSGLLSRLSEVETKVEYLPSLWEHERQLAEASKDEATKQHRKAAAERRKFEGSARAGEEGGEESEEEEARRFLEEHGAVGGGNGVQPVPSGMEHNTLDDLRDRAAAVGITPFL